MILVLSFLILISCESKEMKTANTFILLEDWKNAIEKLDLEIKNNPKNTEAYQLLLQSKFNLYFANNYQVVNYLDPYLDNNKFPLVDENSIREIFLLYDRIKKLDSNYSNSDIQFFKAVYFYYKWSNFIELTVNMESEDFLKYLELRNDLYQQRCENETFLKSYESFKNCASIESEISDNAYLWLLYLDCDTTLAIPKFANDFKIKYPNSDLKGRVDYLVFQKELWETVELFKDSPDSGKASKALSLCLEYLKKYPGFTESVEIIPDILVDYVVANNREYVVYDEGYKYFNSTELINYLTELSNTDFFDLLNIRALENISEYLGNIKDYEKQNEIFSKILEYDLEGEKQDDIYRKMGEIEQENNNFSKAIEYYETVDNLDDLTKYYLWECYSEIGDFSSANSIKTELENSGDVTIKYLLDLSSQTYEIKNLKISDLDAKFDSYSIKITGYVINNLKETVYDVKVKANVSDENGNNAKESFDYLDLISPGKKSNFEISVYYGNNRPSSIQYGARVVNWTKY